MLAGLRVVFSYLGNKTMNIAVLHSSMEPIIYGLCLFLSVMSMAWKIKRQQYVGFFAEVFVVALILIIHGGSVTGGFAATIAGLLSGWFMPFMFRGQPQQDEKLPVTEPRQVFTDWEIYQMYKAKH